ncbi:MAG: Gfo/Idh/MocA family protein, partial [Chloroflexota bacterium]
MNIAFIGVAHHHTAFYLQPVQRMVQHHVTAVADPNPEVARAMGEQVGCAWSADYRALLAGHRPDFVFALGRHCDMSAEAEFLIDEGIPFAIEKPVGLHEAEVSRLAAKAAAKGAFAAPAFVMRYNDLAVLLRRELMDERLDYVLFRWFSGRTFRYENPRLAWLLNPAEAGGGCLIHLGVHHLYWFRWLTGTRRPRVRHALVANRAEGQPVEDYSLVQLDAGGVVGTLETGYLRPLSPGTDPAAVPFDMHYLIRTERHHLVVSDPWTIKLAGLDGQPARTIQGST